MDDAVFGERGLESGELLDRRAATDAFVIGDHATVDEDRHDLVQEGPGVLRGGGPLVGLRRILIAAGTRQVPFLADQFRRDAWLNEKPS